MEAGLAEGVTQHGASVRHPRSDACDVTAEGTKAEHTAVSFKVADAITRAVSIPTVGIGAGNECDAQVLVWQDMVGLRSGRLPRFVKQYADVRSVLHRAAREFASEVQAGAFPGPEHSFDVQAPEV